MKITKKKFTQFAVVVLSSFIVLSCGDKIKNSVKKSDKVVKNDSGNEGDEAEKYNNYVHFYNLNLSASMNNAIKLYIRESGEEKIVKKGEKRFFSSPEYIDWDKVMSNIKAKPSLKELDESAGEVIISGKELNELFTLADDYYKSKDFLDDNYVKGQELHTKIIEAIRKYDVAFAKFDLALRKKGEESQNKEMEIAKKEGYEITYNKMLVLKLINEIVDEIQAQTRNAHNISSMDLTKIKPLYEEFNKAQKTLREAFQNEGMLKKENYKDHRKTLLSYYINKTTEFKSEIIDFIKRVETATPIKKSELEKLVKMRESVIFEYNNMN
ncbi:MAG: DUF3829 domain-containing protein [Apibacter sp.]|nr:DUF3829 domain-containing protein [Apibacter sp.]